MELSNQEIQYILNLYNISSYQEEIMIDTSLSDKDIRHNYIIDKKYVLRVNSAKVMTEDRVRRLNRLIQRYNDFGLKAPYYIKNNNNKYILEYNNCLCYVSEYLDYVLAVDVKDKCYEDLINERLVLVSRFSQEYKNVDLIETTSMYSLFDLCPYDQIRGMDEKQYNFNQLKLELENINEHDLVKKWTETYNKIREELKSFYKNLPKCVFQGDENFSNLCVDDNYHIIGLFDFNMSGTEIIVNYLANLALQGMSYYQDENFEKYSPKEIFDMMLNKYNHNTALIQRYYSFSKQELKAYKLYSKIAMISGYWNIYTFLKLLKNDAYKKCLIEILYMIEKFDL